MSDIGIPRGLTIGRKNFGVKCDVQSSRFDDGDVYSFVDDCTNVTYKSPTVDRSITPTQILVFEVTVSNPINVLQRQFDGMSGGRKLLATPIDETVLTGGSFSDISDTIGNVNTNVPDIVSSGVTIRRRVCTSLVTTYTPRTLAFYNVPAGTGLSGNGAANGQYSPTGYKVGVAAGTSFYVALIPYGEGLNSNSEFSYGFSFEVIR